MTHEHSDWEERKARLWALLDSEPEKALSEARQLRPKGTPRHEVEFFRASLTIEAAKLLARPSAASEAIALLNRHIRRGRGSHSHAYNLANALSVLAYLDGNSRPLWYTATGDNRRRARKLFNDVATGRPSPDMASRAMINLGDQLFLGARWVEAYDRWIEALLVDPLNSVAYFKIADMLRWRLSARQSANMSDQRVYGYFARLAKRFLDEIVAIAGEGARLAVSRLVQVESTWRPRKSHTIKDGLAQFVSSEHLALVGTVEGADFRYRRFDDVSLPSIIEKVAQGVPPVIAMFNTLKADYCAARDMLYGVIAERPRDTSLYYDTLDYAIYGVGSSIRILVQRAALDILDRVAVCANEYFVVGEEPGKVDFVSFWRGGGPIGSWRRELAVELARPNTGIIALGELASDMGEGRMYDHVQRQRNTGTHRFTVLHDQGSSPSRASSAIHHYNERDFQDITLQSLRIARSAILYLRDAIASHQEGEKERVSGGQPIPKMPLLPHHYVRGES